MKDRLPGIAQPPARSARPTELGHEHALRRDLANEVHARPSEALETPSRATYLAVLVDPHKRDREISHIAALCDRFLVDPPSSTARQFAATLGELKVKWERHGEFSSFTFVTPGVSREPFSEPPARLLPAGWLAALPGRVLVAAHAKVVAAPERAVDGSFLERHFGANVVVGADVGAGAGSAYTDFRLHADGCSRFLLIDRGFTARQAGRTMQRLFEIEAYRMMALLTLPVARELAGEIAGAEARLASLTSAMAAAGAADESLLQQITSLAANVESAVAASQFRFDAAQAYRELVEARIGELRERRLPAIQPIGEFIERRFGPAMSTCRATAHRLQDLSERVGRTSTLLSRRVGIVRERQNQALLASMDQRAKHQLRLQQAVESLSLVAIVYYAAGLVGYIVKAMRDLGANIAQDTMVGASVPPLAVIAIVASRLVRRHTNARGTA